MSYLRLSAEHWVSPAKLIIGYLISFLICFCIIFLFRDQPKVSLLLIDFIFCTYCFLIFNWRWRTLFLLNPLVVFLLSLSFAIPFVNLGDGPEYYDLAATYGLSGNASLLDLFSSADYFTAIKQLSLGALPVFDGVAILFPVYDSSDYYIWQSTLFVILMAGSAVLAKIWHAILDEHIFAVTLFAIISPTFFELLIAPTRHYLTFIAVWLFFITFKAICQRITLVRILFFVISILLIAISKFAYFIPISIYLAYYFTYEAKISNRLLRISVLSVALAGNLFFLLEFGLSFFESYKDISQTTGNAVNISVNVPIIGLAVKLVYALLAPFPWHNAAFFIETIYGGNFLAFIFHILSSLTGIYFLVSLAYNARSLFNADAEFRSIIVYGLLLSMTIFLGATGFHGYLSIFFPFFSPILFYERYRLSIFTPLFIALVFQGLFVLFVGK